MTKKSGKSTYTCEVCGTENSIKNRECSSCGVVRKRNKFVKSLKKASDVKESFVFSTSVSTEPNAVKKAKNGAPLEVKGLSKKYSSKANFAIKDISFTCNEGEIVGLLGANGAGKSTSLKCITGMIPLTEGEIRILGYDISKNPVEAKSQFSFVNDNHATFVKMTGLQYITFMADVYKVSKADRERRLRYLEEVFCLGDGINRLICNYSHGMKQKICMMGSLIHQPDLWILDEPMVGLDPRTQGAVIKFMHDYVGQGKTILFSTHNLDVVRRICDRVVIINKGTLIADLEITEEMRNDNTTIESYYFSDGDMQ
ncbi:MAG: ATP-binding cassette domain-containing protein [Clostridia bacterium]|nr:ATP-binding cassette domain-containing protein [Clostridia bacterium]